MVDPPGQSSKHQSVLGGSSDAKPERWTGKGTERGWMGDGLTLGTREVQKHVKRGKHDGGRKLLLELGPKYYRRA